MSDEDRHPLERGTPPHLMRRDHPRHPVPASRDRRLLWAHERMHARLYVRMHVPPYPPGRETRSAGLAASARAAAHGNPTRTRSVPKTVAFQESVAKTSGNTPAGRPSGLAPAAVAFDMCPRRGDSRPRTGAKKTSRQPREAPLTRPLLLVEDEPNIIEAIRFILSRDGWRVDVCSDGATALAAIAARRPDLVILDAMLPNRSGFDILHDLRADPATQALPVLMLTARGQRKDRELAERYGVSRFMTKPFANSEILASVRELAGT